MKRNRITLTKRKKDQSREGVWSEGSESAQAVICENVGLCPAEGAAFENVHANADAGRYPTGGASSAEGAESVEAAVSGNDTARGISSLKAVEMIKTSEIAPNPAQPRKYFSEASLSSLARSISRYGIIQPLSVRRREEGGYELVAGERRLRAAKMAGLTFVPCVICHVDRKHSAVLAIIENLQRAELNMFEEAESFLALSSEYGMTQEEIARRICCSQSSVANKLRLLRFSEEERQVILENALTERHARALLRLRCPEDRAEALSRCIAAGLNVAATEELVESVLNDAQLPLEADEKKPRGKRTFILKDVRMFYNSVNRAVDLVRSAGVSVTTRRIDREEETELIIVIPRGRKQA